LLDVERAADACNLLEVAPSTRPRMRSATHLVLLVGRRDEPRRYGGAIRVFRGGLIDDFDQAHVM
jgi:hypothetical protein